MPIWALASFVIGSLASFPIAFAFQRLRNELFEAKTGCHLRLSAALSRVTVGVLALSAAAAFVGLEQVAAQSRTLATKWSEVQLLVYIWSISLFALLAGLAFLHSRRLQWLSRLPIPLVVQYIPQRRRPPFKPAKPEF
ncbi:MAG: hypothetical protein AAGF94_04650 [Pseudomonadota bacterium]